ncbi:unnamed protein product [Moneuplotes crassus]|uniref:Phosphatidic acid phosphatase type 2/haloperoxidase domain-containing protein n=1 Tax=Euplotes crassus TaxID=5936 RepID=A0AAD2D2C1_EUPCR|nr:unnamed protein product [Moneuplotes crassus]
MSNHCDDCLLFFKFNDNCPILTWDKFSEMPLQYLISLEMALTSAQLYFDLLIMLNFARTKWNRIHLGAIYAFILLSSELILKPFFQQPRPEGSCIDGYGFPSGHATSSAIIIIFILTLYSKGWIRSRLFVTVYILLMLNQSYSRIYLNYHSVEQVISGFMIGLVSSLLLLEHLPISENMYMKSDNGWSTELKVCRVRAIIIQTFIICGCLLHPLLTAWLH